VCNKLPELYHLLYGDSNDIVIITESWLNSRIPNSLIEPDCLYTIVRCDRSSDRIGGGVCAFVRKPLSVVEIALDPQYVNLELCCFDVHCFGAKLRFINIYRPPSCKCDNGKCNCIDMLISCLTDLTETKNACIITGDLNCADINWPRLTAPSDGVQDRLLNFTMSNGFYQFVQSPTRCNAILDVVFSNEPLVIGSTCVKQPFSNSDHSQVDFTVFVDSYGCNVDPINAVKRYDWSCANYDEMALYLASVDWYGLLTVNLTADAIWDAFCRILDVAIDKCVPIIETAVSNVPRIKARKHYPIGVRKAIARKRCLWRQHKLQPNDTRIEASYRAASGRCRQLIRNHELKSEHKVINAKNAGSFYNFINKKLSCKKGVGALTDAAGNIITDDKHRAEVLNQYFSSVCTVDDGSSQSLDRVVPQDVSLDNVSFSPDKVAAAIKKLKRGKSSGPDGYPSTLFKELSASLVEPLSLIYTSFMSIGIIPNAWRHAIVTPVYKSGSAASVSNYRPISLTSVACKIMERIVSIDMLHYLRANNIITKHQHGFLSRRSTCTNLLETLNDWTLAIRDKRSVVVAYIDYSKAFDCVSREKLLVKLKAYGIADNLLRWIDNFLSRRTQQTRIGTSLSDSIGLASGVVQGSVLGPLLFLLFINDVVNIVSSGDCTSKLYADDIKLYMTLNANDDILHFQDNIDALYAWSQKWQLTISDSKCASMCLRRSSVDSNVYINNNVIKSVNEYKDLGVIVDSNLRFKSHIDHIVVKANTRACLIHKCFVSKDISTLVRAFITYVRPLLEYASCIWSPSYSLSINLIESVQRKFTKRLPGCEQLDYKTRLTRLNLESLELRRLHLDLICVYKILFGIIDIDATNLFTLSSTSHNTRGHAFKLTGTHCRINIRQHFFAERIVNPWNSLIAKPEDFSDLKSFVRCLNNNDFNLFLELSSE
jgi:Reverse transcriptase (RNA-dependent DNA polymerase)/Endonuclease-reverse transcriptase